MDVKKAAMGRVRGSRLVLLYVSRSSESYG